MKTVAGALHQVRLQGRGITCLLQNREADIRIVFDGRRFDDREALYFWYSEREDRWVIATETDVLANSAGFAGPFEVRRAD